MLPISDVRDVHRASLGELTRERRDCSLLGVMEGTEVATKRTSLVGSAERTDFDRRTCVAVGAFLKFRQHRVPPECVKSVDSTII